LNATKLILLPGMDGTGDLFAPLLEYIPAAFGPRVIRYPTHQMFGYDQLLNRIEDELVSEESIILLGESFSGPLAIRYAARHPAQVRALILAVSFARFSIPWFIVECFKRFARARPTDWMLRWMLASREAPVSMIHQLRRTLRKVDPLVIAHRIAQVSCVDVRSELSGCRMPVLYLCASDDRIVRTSRRREIEQACPGVVVRTLASPHLLLQTAPAEAWRELQLFLRETDR
jgi:pimeloyl-ACP methyl ester carboxylesterase